MSTSAPAPSEKQMRYLRNLAAQRGESFTYPHSAAEASAEIGRLCARRPGSQLERRIESEQLSRELAERGDAASVRESEIVGYGSSARWR